ncbi:hypothetical protein LTR08_008437 [Meristemomyces frigidus]|nr:hypothetical protein LTR08_008437 [Meristemomyces frigidus]
MIWAPLNPLTLQTAFHMLEAPATGAEAAYLLASNRRRTTQLPLGPYEAVHRKLPSLFSCQMSASPEGDDDGSQDGTSPDENERQENFLDRVHSYSKLMHAHTKCQLGSPATGTLPSYTKAMHAFTLSQLNQHKDVSKSERSSPQLGASGRHIHLPVKVCMELSKLSLDEVPAAPSNTPEPGETRDMHGTHLRKMKRRSLTEPIPRDFVLASKCRGFAIS